MTCPVLLSCGRLWCSWARAVARTSTVLDVKRRLAIRFSLPYPKAADDSRSKMLRLQCLVKEKDAATSSWEMLDDDVLIRDKAAPEGGQLQPAEQWRLEMKAMKLGEEECQLHLSL